MLNISTVVVIPCYKAEKHIENVVSNIPDNVGLIILVNDASPDNTFKILKKLSDNSDRILVETHERNQGVGGAMKTGFKKAIELGADLIIKIDSDGQMDASQISKFINEIINNNFDFVKGNRFYSLKSLKNMPVIRKIGNLGLSFMIKAASGYWHILDPTNGFFCIKSDIVKKIDFENIANRFFFETSLIIELYYTGAIIKDIPLPAIYNNEKSNLSVWKTLFSFPPKLFKAYIKRLFIKYFVFDFNLYSIFMLFGIPLFLFGVIFGTIKWIHYASLNITAPAGTIMLSVVPLAIGFMMIFATLINDVSSANPFRQ